MMGQNPKLSIIVPVKNDGVNLKIMLKVLSATVECSYEVIVIYDFDEDDCIPVLKQLNHAYSNIRPFKNQYGGGIPGALRTGVGIATGDYILIFAADEIGPVIAIEDMLTLMDDGCDLVSCTRYAYGGRRLGGSLIGGVLSRLANRLFRLAVPGGFSDATTGIKMLRRGVYEQLDVSVDNRGWAVAFEIGIKAQLAGLQLGEVPIVSIDRLYGGKSTFKLGNSLWNYLYWFFWGVKHSGSRKWQDKNPILIRSSTYFNKQSETSKYGQDQTLGYRRDGLHRERAS